MLITLAAGVLYLQQNLQQSNQPAASTPQPTAPVALIIEATVLPTDSPTISPTQPPAQSQALNSAQGAGDDSVPVDVVAELLAQPGDTAPPADHIFRRQTAYTIAPVRPRAGVEDYTIQPGDNLDKISAQFGISKDTIAWNNNITYVNLLNPGDKLTILPVDGILYPVEKEITIQAIAALYKVSPYAIIDSEYNRLQNANPDTLLPAGISVLVPGGTTAQQLLYWNPPIQSRDKSGKVSAGVLPNNGMGSDSKGDVSFGGGPGSCGFEPTGGRPNLRVPLGGGYTVIRGFFPGHSGIDLAAPVGTTVFAAADGTVIFAGWSNWGYGNSIVLAHGSLFTLYGHLSRINVSCGQVVVAGNPIGAVGTTGNSTGPHLHFEIRPNGVPVNPTQYLSF
jgi:murein DD-endopeptidase MepM/ murein hydrolase activator NlpD